MKDKIDCYNRVKHALESSDELERMVACALMLNELYPLNVKQYPLEHRQQVDIIQAKLLGGHRELH